jgi:hypothetical protein
MKKLVCVILLIFVMSFASCSSLDVVSTDAVRSFSEVLTAFPPAKESEPEWAINAPGGGAGFYWSNESMVMTVETSPFINAGLDIAELDPAVYNNADENSFYLFTGSFDMLNQNIKDTPLEQFKADLKFKRKDLSYHTALDHYGISFGNGNMFEWAKDLTKNSITGENQDKDIVFVLNPEPLIKAGVDPSKVQGWAYAQVSVDVDGKPADVWKFLKPFNIK